MKKWRRESLGHTKGYERRTTIDCWIYLKALALDRHEDRFDEAWLELDALDVVDVDDALTHHFAFETDRVRVRAGKTAERHLLRLGLVFGRVAVGWALEDRLGREAQLVVVLDHLRCETRLALIDNSLVAVGGRTRLLLAALALASTLASTAAAAATVAVAIRVGLPRLRIVAISFLVGNDRLVDLAFAVVGLQITAVECGQIVGEFVARCAEDVRLLVVVMTAKTALSVLVHVRHLDDCAEAVECDSDADCWQLDDKC